MNDLTPIEAAVLHLIQKPLRIPAPWADVPALFVLRVAEDPDALAQMVYNAVDWDAIKAHMEQGQ